MNPGMLLSYTFIINLMFEIINIRTLFNLNLIKTQISYYIVFGLGWNEFSNSMGNFLRK